MLLNLLLIASNQETSDSNTAWLVWGGIGLFALWLVARWLLSNQNLLKSADGDDDAYALKTAQTADSAAQKDDFTTLEGIGPKAAQALQTAGINSFEALSQSSKEKIQEALKASGQRAKDPTDWIKQAEFAAKGDAKSLKRLQTKIKNARK